MTIQAGEALAGALAAAGVAALYLGVANAVRWRPIERRLGTFVGDGTGAGLVAAPRPAEAPGAATRRGSSLVRSLQRTLSASTFGALVQRRIVRAGLTLKASDFIVVQAIVAVPSFLVGLLLFAAFPGLLRLLAGAGLGVAGFLAPLLVLGVRAGMRLKAFEQQLPQAIDSMAGTLQAGSALPQAMEIIAREMLPPLSVEVRRALREMELGLSLNDALANLLDRVPSSDLMMLTSAIAIQSRVGGDLAGILKGLSHTIRERLRIRNEINVLTAQGRYSAYVITALPILLFLFLYLVRRAYIMQLFLPGITQVLFVAGVLGIILGFYSMKKIATVDI